MVTFVGLLRMSCHQNGGGAQSFEVCGPCLFQGSQTRHEAYQAWYEGRTKIILGQIGQFFCLNLYQKKV